MKIVLYFSAVFGLFWLIHGVLSHRDPAKRNSIRHTNAHDKGEYLSSESSSPRDKVLIKSESPLRGRKIHQTAWSKEESDGEKDEVIKQSGTEKTSGPETPWTLEKILKYLTSLVYPTDGTDQPSRILITSEVLEDMSHGNPKTKIKQKSTDERTDEFSKNPQKNGRREHSSTYKNSYLEDYYETLHTEGKSDIYHESNESDENSFEYENSEEDDETQINYKTSTKKYRNVKYNNFFQDSKDHWSNNILKKSDQSSSSDDNEITENEECFEDTDENSKQNSLENQNTMEVILKKKSISKNDDIEEFNEENNYRAKQKTVSNQRHKGIKNMLRSRTKKDSIREKINPKIIVLNGTSTSQSDKSSQNEITQETTSISKQKSKVELLNTENILNEELLLNEHQNLQVDSYAVGEAVETKTNNENILSTSVSQKTIDEFTDSLVKLSVLNNSNDTEENITTSSVKKSKPTNREQENKASFTETIQTALRTDNKLETEAMKTENVQNEETLIITNSINNIAEQNLNENNVAILEVNSKTLTDVMKQDNMLTINNEEVINKQGERQIILMNDTEFINYKNNEFVPIMEVNPVLLADVTRQENIQIVNNEETNNKAIEIQTVVTNNTELNNSKNKEFNIQNKDEKFMISEMQTVSENQDEFAQLQTNQISVTKENQQNFENLDKNINNQVNETIFISKDDIGYEYILQGNEFVPYNTHNEENQQGLINNNMVYNTNESENKSQLLTDSIVTMLQNVKHIDAEQQESFDTILEFLYKHSKNPLILSLKGNSNATN